MKTGSYLKPTRLRIPILKRVKAECARWTKQTRITSTVADSENSQLSLTALALIDFI